MTLKFYSVRLTKTYFSCCEWTRLPSIQLGGMYKSASRVYGSNTLKNAFAAHKINTHSAIALACECIQIVVGKVSLA